MVDYFSIPDSAIPMSMRALRRLLKEKGWKVEKLTVTGANDLVLTRPDGRILKIASSTPPTTSAFALHLADDKLSSYALIHSLGITQPETVECLDDLSSDAARLLHKYHRIVIKPVDSAHGHGITTGITNASEIPPAVKLARSFSPTGRALAQQQVESNLPELRVICINYKFVMAIARIPAAVTGDGVHSVSELIDIENTSGLRSVPYTGNLAFIDRPSAEKYLGEKLSFIPAPGERFRVSPTCNVGQGGTVEDFSGHLTSAQIANSEQLALSADLPVVGIDFCGNYILELNACPSLHYPFSDPLLSEKCVRAYIEYLETL